MRALIATRWVTAGAVSFVCFAGSVGCREVSRYSNRGDHYEGDVVSGSFVRSGIERGVRMCVTLDAEHLQDRPGTLTTSDRRFRQTPLRPIPQVWNDPLSTLSFGDGRRQNLVYLALPDGPEGDSVDTMAIVSLMEEGGLEVRLLRGASAAGRGEPNDAGGLLSPGTPLFGIFGLDRREGSCSF